MWTGLSAPECVKRNLARAQLVRARLSEQEVPSSILGDFNVCFDFKCPKKRSTDKGWGEGRGGGGGEGAPSASLDPVSELMETTDDVK